jgi:hypothetical protein
MRMFHPRSLNRRERSGADRNQNRSDDGKTLHYAPLSCGLKTRYLSEYALRLPIS